MVTVDVTLHPKDICRQILLADRTIRFAGIADKMGKIVASELREGVKPRQPRR
jgi:hypothetical protein